MPPDGPVRLVAAVFSNCGDGIRAEWRQTPSPANVPTAGHRHFVASQCATASAPSRLIPGLVPGIAAGTCLAFVAPRVETAIRTEAANHSGGTDPLAAACGHSSGRGIRHANRTLVLRLFPPRPHPERPPAGADAACVAGRGGGPDLCRVLPARRRRAVSRRLGRPHRAPSGP